MLPTNVKYETPPISAFDMSKQLTFSSIIYLRDFVDTVTDDSTRVAPNHFEIHADINIFDEDGFDSPDIVTEPIRARIHVYMTRAERDLYLPNTFFYADGRFSTVLSADGDLEISIQALSLMRHVHPPAATSLWLTDSGTQETWPTSTSTAATCQNNGAPWSPSSAPSVLMTTAVLSLRDPGTSLSKHPSMTLQSPLRCSSL